MTARPKNEKEEGKKKGSCDEKPGTKRLRLDYELESG